MMWNLHGATTCWVVLKLRCASAMCLLLLPSHYLNHHNRRGQRLVNRHHHHHHPQEPQSFLFQNPVLLQRPTTSSRRSLENHAVPRHLVVPSSGSTTTALWHSRSSDNDNGNAKKQGNGEEEEQERPGRLEKLRRKTRGVVVGVKSFLRGGRSMLAAVFRERETTEMEAANNTHNDNSTRPSVVPSSSSSSLLSFNDDKDGDSSSTSTTTTVPSLSETSQPQQRQRNNGDNESSSSSLRLPRGPRWAISHPETDLSGTWKPVITSEFKREYERYLKHCGTSYVFRQVCLNFAGTTREHIRQVDQGRTLHLHGTTPAGGWKRSLISSGAGPSSSSDGGDGSDSDYETVHAEFLDPDQEWVKVEAWWEESGRVHKSFMRNKPKVCGGEFESRRYLTTNDRTGEVLLVCESTFHPSTTTNKSATSSSSSSIFQPAFVRWTYQRES